MLQDGTFGFSSLSVKTKKYNRNNTRFRVLDILNGRNTTFENKACSIERFRNDSRQKFKTLRPQFIHWRRSWGRGMGKRGSQPLFTPTPRQAWKNVLLSLRFEQEYSVHSGRLFVS